jgi:Na+-translocating ferredoxin:NAD+ oxidoreductase RnfG subunit
MKAELFFVPMAIVAAATPAHAKVYLSVEQAQKLLFPGASFQAEPVLLTEAQAQSIEKSSDTNVLSRQVQAWRVSTGGWVVVDQVVGKHEFIPIAVAIDASGAVKGVEILEYREAYGEAVRDPKWLAQFNNKHNGDRLRLTQDVQNISGATLSAKHITDGIRRVLATHAIAIAPH